MLQIGARRLKRHIETPAATVEELAYLMLHATQQQAVSPIGQAREVGLVLLAAEVEAAQKVVVTHGNHGPEWRIEPEQSHQ